MSSTASKSLSRKISRESAFQVLYGTLKRPGLTRREFELTCLQMGLEFDEYSWELVDGTRKNLPILTEKLSSLSSNWRIERMPEIDLAILALASFEILFRSDIPKTVSINEAIELAKKYGEVDSPLFINGILDKLPKAE